MANSNGAKATEGADDSETHIATVIAGAQAGVVGVHVVDYRT